MLRILCILIMLVITFRNWCVKKIVGFCKKYVKKKIACLYLTTLVYLMIKMFKSRAKKRKKQL